MTGSPLELYSAYLDGQSLSDAQVARLRAWIDEDEGHAAEFVQFALVHSEITDRLMLGRLIDDLAAHRLGVITPESLAEVIRTIEASSPRVSPLISPAASPIEPASTKQLSGALAALVAFVCVGGWAIWHWGAEPKLANLDQRPAPAAAPKGDAAVNQAPKARVVAKLGASFDAKWPSATPRRPGDALVEGGRLRLLGGVVQLEMASGATVVVEGPSQLELIGPEALRLDVGKAAVRIDDAATSFIVETSTTQVVDLGTEFGVETNAGGDVRVMVFDGAVALADPGRESLPPRDGELAEGRQRVEAGYQVTADASDQSTVQRAAPQPVANPRYFLRPDEVGVRLRALAGSTADYKLAAHYERQRIEQLLAYQAFDALSSGTNYVLGMAGDGAVSLPIPGTSAEFVDAADGAAGGIDVQNGPVFLELDTSETGPFARAGMLNPSARLGRSGTEVWLTWHTQRILGVADHSGSAGLSLMFGEASDVDEPMFFGRISGDRHDFCVQTAWGGASPPAGERVTAEVDFDPTAPGVETREVDQQAHAWVVRIEFREGADRVSVWVDQELSMVTLAPPQAMIDIANVEFDRIRLAVNRGDEVWRFSDFAMALSPNALRQLSGVAAFREDK